MITYKAAKTKAVFHKSNVNMAVEYKDAWEFCAMKNGQVDGMPFFITKENGDILELTEYMLNADDNISWENINFETGDKVSL